MSLVNNREEIEIYLEHYGKKGMRWGVRKARKAGRRIKKGAKKEAQWQLGQTSSQKKARAEAKASIKKAGSRIKKGAKKEAQWQLGQTPSQKKARAEAKATMKKYGSKTMSALKSPQAKTAMKVGAGVVANVVAAYGTYKVLSYLDA